jgi:hypothetical protein
MAWTSSGGRVTVISVECALHTTRKTYRPCYRARDSGAQAGKLPPTCVGEEDEEEDEEALVRHLGSRE